MGDHVTGGVNYLSASGLDWLGLLCRFYSNIFSELLKKKRKENDECVTERWEDGSLIDSWRTNVRCSSAFLPHTPSLSPLCFTHFPFPLFIFLCVNSSLEPCLSRWQSCIPSFFALHLFFLLLDVFICHSPLPLLILSPSLRQWTIINTFFSRPATF